MILVKNVKELITPFQQHEFYVFNNDLLYVCKTEEIKVEPYDYVIGTNKDEVQKELKYIN